MPPDNSESFNEFEMALRQAWETLRDRAESRKKSDTFRQHVERT